MRKSPTTPIAVVGMACRLPGGIDSPDLLWEALLRGDEPEATAINPRRGLLLETSWEAVAHAGLDRAALGDTLTGVFAQLTDDDDALPAADTHFSSAFGRVAYALGVHRPSLTADSASSSDLLAVHMACRSLQQGESDLAFAGASTAMLDPRSIASGQGHSTADGSVPDEGCVVVVLKRFPDAQRDGDRILAVVRGTAADREDSRVSIATPSTTAQGAAYRAALTVAGVEAATIGMMEAHGPVSANGYDTDNLGAPVSLKTSLGQQQATSGVLGLMKAVLAVQHGVVPQNAHCNRLPDDLSRIDTELFVPQENTPWPTHGHHTRRAAVSSYGFSGTNVHVILEEPPNLKSSVPDDISA